eukprot:6557422-Pyramimonas_sp.AAC.1
MASDSISALTSKNDPQEPLLRVTKSKNCRLLNVPPSCRRGCGRLGRTRLRGARWPCRHRLGA